MPIIDLKTGELTDEQPFQLEPSARDQQNISGQTEGGVIDLNTGELVNQAPQVDINKEREALLQRLIDDTSGLDSMMISAGKTVSDLGRFLGQGDEETPVEKQAYRAEHARPLLVEYKAWLDKSIQQVPPKSALGKALTYSLNQWPKLIRYLEDGELNIDNNRAERAIKPFVIGRKNWLFSNTANGAHASSILYSLVETAKANDLIPFDYLHHIIDVLSERQDDETLDKLLPWNISLQAK